MVDNAAPDGRSAPSGSGSVGPVSGDPVPVPTHGVGPHPAPWPDDPRLDPGLLAHGDRRNVVDRYRYWTVEAIVADLDTRRFAFHVAIENLRHDMNIGTVVRNANAFGAAAVHVVGRRQWNRRGAMVTDRYVHVHHHPDVASFRSAADERGLALVGIDVVDGSEPIDGRPLPRDCALVFGQEGSGLSADLLAACDEIRDIPMFGSTRSVNVGVASGIAMTEWLRQHGPGSG
ncbi:MAG: TrmH family RNA methyltransferase [Microthrixaceae bacterium]